MSNRHAGSVRVGSIHGAEVFLHWSLPVGGAFVWLLFGRGAWDLLHYTLAYGALIALHELGHLTLARKVGLRVESITVGGEGGHCRFERPKTLRQAYLAISGGLVFQLFALVLALILIETLGFPDSGMGQAFAKVFTAVNVFLLVLNVVPVQLNKQLETDGYLLWLFLQHQYFRGPNPYPEVGQSSPVFQNEKSLLEMGFAIPDGANYGIEIFNDETTPAAFVLEVLSRKVGVTERDAVAKMLTIHNAGGLVIACRTLEEAELLAGEITSEARSNGHALVCRALVRTQVAA